jgi:sporulation protein YlmC with PRC-barrel domain
MGQALDTTTRATLVPLSETGLTLASGPDIRGREAVDLNGERIGTIEDLLVDSQSHEVRLVKLTGGGILGIGDQTWLIPVEAIRDIGEQAVRLDRAGSEVAGGPTYQPDLVLPEEERLGPVYDYYGYPPFWVDRMGRPQ